VTELQIVLDKLDGQDDRLAGIEKAISQIAVQDEKILNLQSQVNALWKKQDAYFGPKGVVSELKNNQANCPKDRVKTLETRSWGLMVSILLMVLSGLGGIMFFSFRV